jgi:hypothetical protein
VHLEIDIEDLWNVAYPDRDEDEDSDESTDINDESSMYTSDGTYTCASSSFSEGEDYLDNEEENSDDDTSSYSVSPSFGDDDSEDVLMEEIDLEYSDLSDLELADLKSDEEALDQEEGAGRAGGLLDRKLHRYHLSDLQLEGERATALNRVEFSTFSSLRRLLLACAPTLEVLTLSWRPFNSTFFLEAVLPLLPRLRVLCWDTRLKEDYHLFDRIPCSRKTQPPVLFPSLQHLDIKAGSRIQMVEDLFLFSPLVPVVSAPQAILQYVVPKLLLFGHEH